MDQTFYALPPDYHAVMYEHYYQRAKMPDATPDIKRMCDEYREHHLQAFINTFSVDMQLQALIMYINK